MTPADQCPRKKRLRRKTTERCLRKAGHEGPHVFASSPPLETFLRLIELLDGPRACGKGTRHG